ncbi:MAG: hypothetical protein MJZ40_01925 [Bacteroidaceae bacterium]|nr:hypothetical protein [Bacteroidaceae bacterium]
MFWAKKVPCGVLFVLKMGRIDVELVYAIGIPLREVIGATLEHIDKIQEEVLGVVIVTIKHREFDVP